MEFRKGLGVVPVIAVGVKFGLLPSRAPYYLVRQILSKSREPPPPPISHSGCTFERLKLWYDNMHACCRDMRTSGQTLIHTYRTDRVAVHVRYGVVLFRLFAVFCKKKAGGDKTQIHQCIVWMDGLENLKRVHIIHCVQVFFFFFFEIFKAVCVMSCSRQFIQRLTYSFITNMYAGFDVQSLSWTIFSYDWYFQRSQRDFHLSAYG